MTYLTSTILQAAHWCQSAVSSGPPAHAVPTSPSPVVQIDVGMIAVKVVVAVILLAVSYGILLRAFRAMFWQRLLRFSIPALLVAYAARELYQACDMIGTLLANRGITL